MKSIELKIITGMLEFLNRNYRGGGKELVKHIQELTKERTLSSGETLQRTEILNSTSTNFDSCSTVTSDLHSTTPSSLRVP
jgi:hypothetical protein